MFENKKGRHKLPSLNFSLDIHTSLLCTAQNSKTNKKQQHSVHNNFSIRAEPMSFHTVFIFKFA